MNDAFSITPAPNDEEAAAAVAAIAAYLTSTGQPPVQHTAMPSGWQRATKLTVQGLRPMRTTGTPRWGTVERLRRSTGFYGVTGL